MVDCRPPICMPLGKHARLSQWPSRVGARQHLSGLSPHARAPFTFFGRDVSKWLYAHIAGGGRLALTMSCPSHLRTLAGRRGPRDVSTTAMIVSHVAPIATPRFQTS